MNIGAVASLPPTIRLYNQDPYMTETEATVLYTEGNIAVFDKTVFYAESGGQTSDIGCINGNDVIDVQKKLGELFSVRNKKVNVSGVKINTRIIHTFSNDVDFNSGDKVKMKIDWGRRYKIMKHHTLSHFLFHAFNTVLNQYNVDIFLKGCSINEERASYSLTNKITDEQLAEIKNLLR
ncbi:alanine--tRNA ligase-related protein [Lonsdalea populi]|uniref:alanine--tRNA ligase-related protein n=1 Tax=Lonsdalea populi TaxID=1172565 RepID=UPI000DCA3297|nr:alanine--tRNA ligase-related protein [Lonsdalea populi]RAT66972.1 hypothetical protein AU504_14925 [Lonsdalea populi]RAT71246.1 hypothetical protein AU505_09315 [Lonsdalea populi]RAT75296.1 hypothetical protein AU506_09990 [Lonsdalea populi]RAT78592.1 hypothetical protein AU507_08265 [Lonsdalea populi]